MKHIIIIFICLLFNGCSSCRDGEDEPVRIGSQALTLQVPTIAQSQAKEPNIKVINIGPSKREDGEKTEEPKTESGNVPSEVNIDNTLTSRLKEKLEEAFAGKGTKPPEIEIYTGVMSLEDFSKYYEGKGYKIQRTSIPASQIVAPLLDEKPELSSKISLANYAGININQIIVEGLNISAADKYIDPETYEVVYKTFVTVTRMK